MRVWDADPATLRRQHLRAEHHEFGTLWPAIHLYRSGTRKGGWTRHPECVRFAEHPDGLTLLCARHDFIRAEATRREYKLVAEPDDQYLYRRWNVTEWKWGDWMGWVDWPVLPGGPWTPWKRDRIPYFEYAAQPGGALEDTPLGDR